MITINGFEISGRMPIFTAENRELVRRGVKTQTRRIIKTQPKDAIAKIAGYFWLCEVGFSTGVKVKCPYGAVGDIRVMPEPLVHRSVGNFAADEYSYSCAFYSDDETMTVVNGKNIDWRWQRDTLSSMFMPTWAGRTLVRYTDIRVERLQDISEVDAKAEGCQPGSLEGPCMIAKWDARSAYELLWDSINSKKHPWSDNPWVWVIEWELLK